MRYSLCCEYRLCRRPIALPGQTGFHHQNDCRQNRNHVLYAHPIVLLVCWPQQHFAMDYWLEVFHHDHLPQMDCQNCRDNGIYPLGWLYLDLFQGEVLHHCHEGGLVEMGCRRYYMWWSYLFPRPTLFQKKIL